MWKDILTDPAVIADLAKRKRGLSYAAPADLTKALNAGLSSLPADKLKDVNEVLLKKFSS